MKHYRLISTVLLVLSFGLALFVSWQTGILGFTDGSASEQPPGNRPLEEQETQIKRRERNLAEKETILKEQLARYEKLIVGLRSKLETKEKEAQATLSDKDRAYKATLSDKDRAYKAKLVDLENQKKEIKTLQDKIADQSKQKTQSYTAIYEKMESKKAAKILDEMEISIATAIIESIKQDKAADILSKMTPERVRSITERANAKRQPASIKVSSPKGLDSLPQGRDSKVNPAIENIPEGGE